MIRANRVLELVPAAAVSALMQHHLAVAADQHSTLLQEAAAERRALTDALEQHKATLQPGMLHPNRWVRGDVIVLITSVAPVVIFCVCAWLRASSRTQQMPTTRSGVA